VPDIAVAPTTLNFGIIDVPNSNTQTTTITNNGTAILNVTGLNLNGTTEFSLGTAPAIPFEVPANGGTATVDVVYTPVDNGQDLGTLDIVSDDPDQGTVTVDLDGTGNVPVADACNFSVDPASLDFGTVDIGASSTLSTIVTNTGTVPCEIAASVTPAPGEFALASGTPVNVAVGGNATVSVSYTPSDEVADTGNLNLTSTDTNALSLDVPLTGTGQQPPVNACDFSVAPTTLAFGSVTIDTSSTLQTTVTNNGTVECSITATVTPAPGEFSLTSGTAVSVPANGGTASVSVAYAPVDLGDDIGNLNLTDDADSTQTVDVPLSGTGVEAGVPCTGITIDNAEWRTQGNGQLRVSATGVRDGPIVLSNALDLTQIIDTRNGKNGKGNFNINGRNLNPVPCRVRVEQAEVGLCGEADVANAPADCAPKPEMPVARGDTYATAVGKTLTVQLSRVSGVLYNDFDTDIDGNNIGNGGLTAVLVSGPTAGTLNVSPGQSFDGSFEYVPGPTLADNTNDSFTYQAEDADGNLTDVATVNIHVLSDQPDFKIMMNYELGMHCTGFEFSYCCVLPPYNSILAQVVKPQTPGNPQSNADFPRLLEGDPHNGLDGLGRETVLRDFDGNGNFQKYYLKYFHDAQPRREGNMPGTFNDQTSTLISDIEGNSMLYHNTPYDSACTNPDPDPANARTGDCPSHDASLPIGALVRGTYNGVPNVVLGDNDYMGDADNYANGWLNHFYIYADLEGSNPNDSSLEADKIRLGVQVVYPKNVGAALQPMGPIGAAGTDGNGDPCFTTDPADPNHDPSCVPNFDSVLTFSADTGTVVYTQMKVLENLPVMLTSPRIWEALGMPLTPFEDSIGFFAEAPGSGPGSVDEDSIRPYVAMKAQLHVATCDEATGTCTNDGPYLSNGQPVIGHGTAPIDIPNCERCHSVPAFQPDGVTPNVNSPSYVRGNAPIYGPEGMTLQAITDLEINYWKAYYPSLQTGTDWYARLKGAAVNMLAMHDNDFATGFLDNYPTSGLDNQGNPEELVDMLGLPASKQIPQNTRMGHESIICQKCHGDNVIAAVNPLGQAAGSFPIVPPISEAIHRTHQNESEPGGVIVFNDGLGRDGGCQGCHPAHRSDGVMDNYPITTAGNNANAGGDNRLNQGGCFVGRDVHSNPLKDVDGAETPEHLNAVGEWLVTNVTNDGNTSPDDPPRGIWCTNCHSQLGQEIWRTEDCNDLIRGDCLVNPRGEPTLADVAAAVGWTEQQAIDSLDPKVPGFDRTTDQTHMIWRREIDDANVATIEVSTIGPGACAPLTGVFNPTFGVDVCVSIDADGDPSVNILSFCTTQDCVDRINNNPADQTQWRYPANPFQGTGTMGAPVPFSAATDGRDHWLAAGEPHCADCHEAPYVEQSGNINPFPPFNYPAKASLMRYSRGHQDLGCQACHESIHGLYPVSAAIDTTSYAQAAALNHDGSHGPLKCGACHQVGGNGLPTWLDTAAGNVYGITDFDSGVTWAHTYTDEADVRDSTCQNCHGNFAGGIGASPGQCEDPSSIDQCYLGHADSGRTSRLMMDKAEIAELGHILGAATLADGTTPNPDVNTERDALCSACHEQELGDVECDDEWREHLTQGRVAESVWEDISFDETTTRCGW